MIISTSIWGDIEVNEKEVYRFEKGIPGFEETTEFVLLDQDEAPFYYLQSLQQKELSFVLVDPFIFILNMSSNYLIVKRKNWRLNLI